MLTGGIKTTVQPNPVRDQVQEVCMCCPLLVHSDHLLLQLDTKILYSGFSSYNMVHTKINPASHPNTRPFTFTERDATCNSCCHKQEDQQQLSFLSVLNHSLVVRVHERGVTVKKSPSFLTKLVLSRIDGAAEAARSQSAPVWQRTNQVIRP